MKVALVIFPFGPSHGSILQTYAIFTKLRELGHEVTIINRRAKPRGLRFKLKKIAVNIKYKIKGIYKGPIFGSEKKSIIINKNLIPFIQSYFGNRVITVYSRDETYNIVISNQFDAYIIGSDQVWRPKYVNDIHHYFLDFLPQEHIAKRIAFCPSFGTDKWEYTEAETRRCGELLRLFDAVAVREESGVTLCREHFGVNAIHLLDPTILYSSDKYLNEFIKGSSTSVKNALSVYFLDRNEEKYKIVNRICKELQLEYNDINNKTEDENAKLSERIAPSLETWIGGFVTAEFVVTDSFHATMFAILFNKPFFTIVNASRGAARFHSLLDDLGLSKRLLLSLSNLSTQSICSSIDWQEVNNKLEVQRNKSIDFIKDALK